MAGFGTSVSPGCNFDVIDVSNPAVPVRVGKGIAQWQGVNQVQMVGDHAYVAGAGHEENLMLINVSNRAQPVQKPGLLLGTWPFPGISVAGGYLYAAHDGDRGIGERLTVFDLSIPGSPSRVGGATTLGRGSAIEVVGHHAYVGVSKTHDTDMLNGLEVFDVSNPAMPVSVGACEGGLGGDYIQVEGQYAYRNGQLLEVIDVKDPTQPRLVGSCKLWGSGFQVIGNLIYVADGSWGLTIMEVELPGTLKLKPPVLSGNTITLLWNGGPGIKLQKTLSLSAPDWRDVPDSEGFSQITVPRSDSAAFFRLVKP